MTTYPWATTVRKPPPPRRRSFTSPLRMTPMQNACNCPRYLEIHFIYFLYVKIDQCESGSITEASVLSLPILNSMKVIFICFTLFVLSIF